MYQRFYISDSQKESETARVDRLIDRNILVLLVDNRKSMS